MRINTIVIILLFLVASASADTLIEDFGLGGTFYTGFVYSDAKCGSQPFTVDAGECFDKVSVGIKENNGGITVIHAQIETDSGGNPSGTKVHANADGSLTTGASQCGGSGNKCQINITLAHRVCAGTDITAGTKYHVVECTNNAAGTNYYWAIGGTGAYTRGSGYSERNNGTSIWTVDYNDRYQYDAALWDTGGGAGVSNSVSFAASSPACGSDTLIATRNYTFVPIENATVAISSCSLYSNASNASVPIATRNNPTNNTEDGFVVTLPSAQTHDYQIICQNNDSSTVDTGNRTYTYSDFAFSSESHDATKYETESTAYSYAFDVGEGVSNVTVAYLDYNGTLLGLSSTGGVNVTLSGSRTLGLEATNNTQYGNSYVFLFEFSNGTSYNVTSSTYYQNVLWAYWQNLSVNPTTYVESAVISPETTVTNFTNAASVLVSHYWNGTMNTAALSGSVYSSSFIAPDTGGFYWDYMNSTLNLTFAGVSLNRTSPQYQNVSVWEVGLVSCPGTVALNFTFADEETFASLFGDMDGTFWGYPVGSPELNASASFNCTNSSYCEVCIAPSWASFVVDSWQTYESPEAYYSSGSYPLRAYFLANASVSNVTEDITLYSGNVSAVKLIEVDLNDVDGQGVADAYVYFAEYYPAENVYRTVAMVLTDNSGLATTYLEPNEVWYRITVTKNNEVLSVFSPQTIACSLSASSCPLVLSLAPESYLEFVEYWDNFAFDCDFNASGLNFLSCSYTDTSGLMKYARLVVNEVGLFSPIGVCDSSVTTTSGTISCNLSNYTDKVVSYSFAAHFAEETLLESGNIGFSKAALFGDEGLLIALILFLLCAAVGAHNPAYSVFMGFVGLVVAWAIGLFSIELSAIVAMGVVAGVIMLKMRS